MNPKSLATAITLLACSCLANSEPVRLGSLSLDWPAGYSVKSTQVPFELAGPNGSKVLVTIMRLGKAASPAASAVDPERVITMNEKFLSGQAQKSGKVVVPLAKESLPDGSILQYVGSDVSSLFASRYFLQYIITAPDGRLGFLTFEGTGEPIKEHEAIKPVFQSAHWLQ